MGTHQHEDTLGCSSLCLWLRGHRCAQAAPASTWSPWLHCVSPIPSAEAVYLCLSHPCACWHKPLSAIHFLAFIPQKHGGGLRCMHPAVWPCPGHSLSVPFPMLLSQYRREEAAAGGDAAMSKLSPAFPPHPHPHLLLLDFNSVAIPGLKQPWCKVRHCTSRWQFLLRDSLVVGVSLYRYKTSRGQAPTRTPLALQCCTAIPVTSPSILGR